MPIPTASTAAAAAAHGSPARPELQNARGRLRRASGRAAAAWILAHISSRGVSGGAL